VYKCCVDSVDDWRGRVTISHLVELEHMRSVCAPVSGSTRLRKKHWCKEHWAFCTFACDFVCRLWMDNLYTTGLMMSNRCELFTCSVCLCTVTCCSHWRVVSESMILNTHLVLIVSYWIFLTICFRLILTQACISQVWSSYVSFTVWNLSLQTWDQTNLKNYLSWNNVL